MTNKYSKTRLLLSVSLIIFLFAVILIGYVSLPVMLFFTGSILFAFNKKWADYAAFSIFIFGFVSSITYKADNCLKSESCADFIYHSLTGDKIETLFIFLSGLVLAYLILGAFKIKNAGE